MSEQETYPLTFDCTNCNNENTYPNYLRRSDEGEEGTAKEVVKRCTTCGAENTISIPAGWTGGKGSDTTLYRGS